MNRSGPDVQGGRVCHGRDFRLRWPFQAGRLSAKTPSAQGGAPGPVARPGERFCKLMWGRSEKKSRGAAGRRGYSTIVSLSVSPFRIRIRSA
jgi:hypothetical protein